jgi:4-hydroxy 2-oxovalerate aldolase
MTVTLLDVTLREAGLANRFSFTADQVAGIALALDRAGVDIVEVGYRRLRLDEDSGACSPPGYLQRIRAVCQRAELAVMIHPADVTLDEYARLREQGIRLVRFAIAPRELGPLAAHAAAAHAAGLRFTVNATRSTEVPAEVVLGVARAAEELGAACFYVADSNGSLYPDRVHALTSRLREATSIALGFHAHDNLRLAFANVLVALHNGFDWIDASLGGAGKGGGNLMLELIAGHLSVRHGRPFDLFALSTAYTALVAPTLRDEGQHGGCTAIFGLLDFNIDRIAELVRAADQRGVPLTELVADTFRTRLDREPADVEERMARS